MQINFGIIGCANIARRMFIPALAETTGAQLIAVAARDASHAHALADEFACTAEDSYESLLARTDIDAVYIPLPPSLHEYWATRALVAGKHVLSEKPLTTDLPATYRLIQTAQAARKILAENWMFVHHRQLRTIDELITSGKLGQIRQLRASFGFPELDPENFRYRADLGGGSLFDAGGYTLRIARHFLSDELLLVGSHLLTPANSEVDRFGSALLVSPSGVTAQLAFGFDSFYQCELELWMTQGKISAPRIFTAPPGFSPRLLIETAKGQQEIEVPADNHFANAIQHFIAAIRDSRPNFEDLLAQATLLESFRSHASHTRN